MPEGYATRIELDGLGMRVNTVERTTDRHDERIKNLVIEAAKQKLDTWQAIDKLRDTSVSLVVKIAFITGGIMVMGVILSFLGQIYIK